MSSNLCQQSQAHRLYSLYLHYDASHTAKHEDPECKAVLQHCFTLFEKDYVVGSVLNHSGQLCSSYPSELAILEKQRDHSHVSAPTGAQEQQQQQFGTEYAFQTTGTDQLQLHHQLQQQHGDLASISVLSNPSTHPFQLPGIHPASSHSKMPHGPSSAQPLSSSPSFSETTSNNTSNSIINNNGGINNNSSNGLQHDLTNQQGLDLSLIEENADQSFDLGESGMMSFQDIKTELDMIHTPKMATTSAATTMTTAAVVQQHQQQPGYASDQDRSRRHILPFPFRIPRPEKKENVAIKEYVASSPPPPPPPPPPAVARKAQESGSPTEADKDKVNDTHELSKQFEKSHFARVRARFVVPCILVRGKNICRSATLSNEVEVFMHSVNQKINDLNQKRKMFLYGTGEKSPDKEDRESSLEKQRMEDIELLHQLGVTYINDLMVENRKVKYGLKVTSSEKVDSFGRYSKFKLVATPYPGVEFFQKFKANKYSARKLCFDWSQNFADAELQLPPGHTDNLGIRWRDYKSWDLIELTQNYLRLYLTHIADDSIDSDLLGAIDGTAGLSAQPSKGLLIHCISGWDRTPLFISLLRISLWADGEAHHSLTAAEILYLTMGYDWFLFNHLLADRSQRGEDIFYFCFYFLKFIYAEEFSLQSVSNLSKNGKRTHRPSFSTQPVSSSSPLLKDIGRLRGGDFGTSTGSETDNVHGYVCDECKVLRKSPNEPLGRDMGSIGKNSQDAASSTDGKPSSWQLVTFSTPPGRDRHGSPRAPFVPTLQAMTRTSGSPLGAKRNSYTTGFVENSGNANSTLDQEVLDGVGQSVASPVVSRDRRSQLGVPQFNARRSSSSGIPDLFADESRRSTQGVSGLDFPRVATSPNLFVGRHVEEPEEIEGSSRDEVAGERQTTPRKRASTFDGGLLLSLGQAAHADGDGLDLKEQHDEEEEEEDLTSGDDDNGDEELSAIGGQVSQRGPSTTLPLPLSSSSTAREPQICQVCHHSFFVSDPIQPNNGSTPLVVADSFTTAGPSIPVNSDALNIPQQPMGMSPKQALERMRVVDSLFAQDDMEQGYSHHHHHGQQQMMINELDRDEGMFQLEIDDRPSYRSTQFSCDKKSELLCLDPPCLSGSGCQEGSLGSGSCLDRDLSVRNMSSTVDETESIEGDENESFWDETSTMDYGCSPGSILNGFGLGLTKCQQDCGDGSLERDVGHGPGQDVSGSARGEDDEEEEEEDDDDDDGAASLNSRQSSIKMDHHENDRLFMPSLKGVFSNADRPFQGRARRQEPSIIETTFPVENLLGPFAVDPAHPMSNTANKDGSNVSLDQDAQGTTSETTRILTRRQKLRELRRLFMDIRNEIGDGNNRSPSRSLLDSKHLKGAAAAAAAAAGAATGSGSGSAHSVTEEDDDSGSSYKAESFSDDPSFQYRSPIATVAAFANRHGHGPGSSPGSAMTASGTQQMSKRAEFDRSQPFFGRGSGSSTSPSATAARQSGESFIVSPVARPHFQQPSQQQRNSQQGLSAPSSNGRKSPFEWAAAAASSAAASISSSASGIVSSGFGHSSSSSLGQARQSPSMKPSLQLGQHQHHHQQSQPHPQYNSPSGSSDYNRPFALPVAHQPFLQQLQQHPSNNPYYHSNSGLGGNNEGMMQSPVSGTTSPLDGSREVTSGGSSSMTATSSGMSMSGAERLSTSRSGSGSSGNGGSSGGLGLESARRRCLVASPMTSSSAVASTSASSTSTNVNPATPTAAAGSKMRGGAENSGRWDWVPGIFV